MSVLLPEESSTRLTDVGPFVLVEGMPPRDPNEDDDEDEEDQEEEDEGDAVVREPDDG
ncbi:hypothetical protein JJB99_24110 [Bradyrhizobium diazoefficiens]|uniref:hypothetical protein n=1 Tax=Bradyrhizobium diazoefficiens TaxID=1355477 RepID=UPI00190A18EC|nr:hypothetical protein [Bradyrhizobium diazoefficiens]QQO12540.1 hypothetical protein JJB99_24110 [Bradyrhizobium diazoefficiens]